MTKFKFLVFIAVLAAFTALAHAGFDDGKAAYERGDYAKAYKEFKKLAEQGDAEAQFKLAIMYIKGLGMAQDSAEAAKWLRKAAEQGYAEAQFNLGVAYDSG